jgi:hypothetical protein
VFRKLLIEALPSAEQHADDRDKGSCDENNGQSVVAEKSHSHSFVQYGSRIRVRSYAALTPDKLAWPTNVPRLNGFHAFTSPRTCSQIPTGTIAHLQAVNKISHLMISPSFSSGPKQDDAAMHEVGQS